MMFMRFLTIDEHKKLFYSPPVGGYYRRSYKNNIPKIPMRATHGMLLLGCIVFYICKYTVTEIKTKICK